jgi:peptidoglycan/LPS O-acetylase OafA/YrhL
VAVVAVILDHLVAWPSGGFVGVDVFFVISGFLITGLLLREHERTGTISFRGFYRRRVKRILPASILVLLVTVVVSRLLFNSSRFLQTALDAASAFLFVGNWRFAATGTDYFQSTAAPSPVQHFWSLAVEEQFYLVWPWLMLLVFALVGRRARGDRRRAHLVAGGVMALITVASFAWAVHESTSTPTLAYFSTFSRVWELGAGALLAVFAVELRRLPDAFRPYLAWAGLAVIVLSLVVVSGDQGFPAPGAALPVLGTALVIAAGTGGGQRGLAPLRNPVMAYLGRISYSLYLWHFPVIVFATALLGDGSLVFSVTAILATGILAVASFHLVEDPIRRSTWLSGLDRRERQAVRRDRRRAPAAVSVPARVAGVAVLGVAVVLLSVAALTPPERSPQSGAALLPSTAPTAEAAGPRTAQDELRQKLGVALSADEWPEFSPPIDDLADQRAPQWTEDGCADVTDRNEARCAYGAEGSEQTVAVIGDSVATSWLPGIIAGLGGDHRIQALTKQGCGVSLAPASAPQSDPGKPWKECADHHAWVSEQLAESPPDILIVAESYLASGRLASRATGAAGAAEWRAGLEGALAGVPEGTRIVTLMAPPGAANLQECYSPVSHPGDCVGGTSAAWLQTLAVEKGATESAGGTFIDTREWFCVSGRCTSYIDDVAAYVDAFHLSRYYSERTGPVIRDAVLAAVG